MRTRLFLRTSEFLWQEGHTAHATAQEAIDETYKMLHVYADFAEEVLAMAVVRGEKPCWERFPGAVNTYSIEAMMQDRKALQAGTSHFLGQNFAKASEIQFSNKNGEIEHAWTTSWGVSTRLIGGLIMVHGDDNGLVVPPRVAPSQIVILPIYRTDEERELVLAYCEKLEKSLREKIYFTSPLRVTRDDRDMRGGEKTWQWVKKGIPLRLEIGPRDVAADAVFMARRDKDPKEKQSMKSSEFLSHVTEILDQIQQGLLAKSREFLAAHTQEILSFEDFKTYFTPVSKDAEKPEAHGGFAEVFALDSKEIEDFIKPLKVTGRCMPLDKNSGDQAVRGTCIFTGKPGARKMLFAKAY
jgi:prolyl-tRNA synthetase